MRSGIMVCVMLSLSLAAVAQNKPKSIWDGVYTELQAERGKDSYDAHCAHCHGDDMTGGDGPSLVGGSFVRSWGSRYLDRFFTKVQTRMPADDVNAISDQDKIDIVALMLHMNGFPAGKTELPLDMDYLATIQIVGRNGPEPAAAGTMVEVLGCLVEEGKDWKLTHATEPAVSTIDDPAADASAAAKQPLGTDTVGLLDVFPRPDAHKGHKMLAKGLLIRNNENISLNVLHLGLVSKTCAP